MIKSFRFRLPILITIVFCTVWSNIHAQTAVNCGDVVESEFTDASNKHTYLITLAPGDKLRASTEALGDYLSIHINVIAPQGQLLTESGDPPCGATCYYKSGYAQTRELSARGQYLIELLSYSGKSTGIYTLYIQCTLRDGTVINPGDTASAITNSTLTNASAPAFSGVGFPGLDPIDFSDVTSKPFALNTMVIGAVAPEGNTILGYKFDGSANENLTLNIIRASGNLNLGLVVLSADNKVVFQASLVTSSDLTTTFTLPSAGQYTIGVFRINLLPPAAPEPTAFQLQATLNP